MNKSIVKVIVVGILFGTIAFFAPFLLIKVMLFIVIAGALFRLFWRGRGHYGRFAMADKIRSMSDEEYTAFKNRRGRCRPDQAATTQNK